MKDFNHLQPKTRSFASDNNSGVIPEALEAIQSVSANHVAAYGNDPVTQKTRELFQEVFGPSVQTYFVFNGTAANLLCLRPLLKSYEGVICAESSHLNNDEGGAPENTLGTKLLTLPSPNGKLSAKDISRHLIRLGDPHRIQPRVVSITQPTELGTLYSIEEMKEISKVAKDNGLYLHIDGSRLVLAAEALGVSLRDLTEGIGADAVSFGGTKNGLLLAEACLFFDKKLTPDVPFYQKQLLQLPGKCRFVSAQFYAFLKNETWRKYARHSLETAKYLYKKAEEIGVELTQKVETNAVFAKLSKETLARARETYFFYVWNEKTYEVRWMTTFDTKKEDIDIFCEQLKSL